MLKLTRREFALGGLAVAVAGPGGLTTEGDLRKELEAAAASLPGEVAAARAAGIALTPEEMAPKLGVPAADDARPLYLELARLREALPAAESDEGEKALNGMLSVGPVTDEARSLARKTLADWQKLLAAAERAAAAPRCSASATWYDSERVDLALVTPVRFGVLLLAAQGALLATDGKPDEAAKWLTAAAQASRHAGAEPVLMGLLLAARADDTVHRGLVVAIKTARGADQQLAYDGLSHRLAHLPDCVRAYRGELVFARYNLTRPSAVTRLLKEEAAGETEARRLGAVALLRQPAELVRDAFDARLIGVYRELFALLRKHDGDLRAAWLAAKALGDAVSKRQGASYYLWRAEGFTADTPVEGAMRCLARARLREALAMLLHDARPGTSWPTAAPANVVDPFSGARLLYRREGDGFAVWSVGPSGDALAPPRPGAGGLVVRYP